ncbi:Alb1-domain-containing protein [Fusarium redolens]|uniref:Alb1-domain-containing protein n=1 Tax=Fusarium redolens TaxID=48865 RepID=A0A9P9GQ53_FUSRE|nr:Alb1-domain-containing protein [Fusarium redolens]KAH7243679.1 Alb1-domain-containing protein [Fusarium redolens]
MAKKKAPSIHSRAARRATDIDIDTDKSLKEVKPPPRDAPHRPSVLAAQHSAGITKKAKRGRKEKMSAKARRRHEKGLEMAAAIVERTKNKVEKSKGRGRNIQQRSKNWDEINRAAEEAEGAESDEEVKQRGVDVDEDMDVAEEETSTAPVAEVTTPAAVPLPADDDGDEIL